MGAGNEHIWADDLMRCLETLRFPKVHSASLPYLVSDVFIGVDI